ncbi:MAG: hypothetical protein ACRD8A_15650 [Candidatus Acidiferrales bacterium]
MPFIRGRYYINPTYGAALEAAREAEDALSSAEQSGREGKSATTISGANSGDSKHGAQGPIHRVEIETTEVVPSHSGRAQRGFVARVHRASVTSGAAAKSGADQDFIDSLTSGGAQSPSVATQGRRVVTQAPETHVFADPRDLADFLQGEFEKDSGR